MKKYMLRGIMVLMFVMLIASPTPANAGSATVGWVGPTTWLGGTTLNQATDLSGYKIYYGTVTGVYPNNVFIPGGTTTSGSVPNLTNGTKYFFVVSVVTAVTSAGGGSESDPSPEMTATIPFKKSGGCSSTTVVGNP